MGCVASTLETRVKIAEHNNDKPKRNAIQLHDKRSNTASSQLPKTNVKINYLLKKAKEKPHKKDETEEEKYGDFDTGACCGLCPVKKNPLVDPRNLEPKKKEGKLKGAWIDGLYVNTELQAIKEENKCCRCKSWAQMQRDKIDKRDDAYGMYLQQLDLANLENKWRKDEKERKENQKKAEAAKMGVPATISKKTSKANKGSEPKKIPSLVGPKDPISKSPTAPQKTSPDIEKQSKKGNNVKSPQPARTARPSNKGATSPRNEEVPRPAMNRSPNKSAGPGKSANKDIKLKKRNKPIALSKGASKEVSKNVSNPEPIPLFPSKLES